MSGRQELSLVIGSTDELQAGGKASLHRYRHRYSRHTGHACRYGEVVRRDVSVVDARRHRRVRRKYEHRDARKDRAELFLPAQSPDVGGGELLRSHGTSQIKAPADL